MIKIVIGNPSIENRKSPQPPFSKGGAMGGVAPCSALPALCFFYELTDWFTIAPPLS
jgi:hypothetical protein